jgi:GTP-binding protein HflX
LVLNKVDAVTDRSFIDVLRARYPHAISVSAKDGTGLDRLGRYVAELLSDGYLDAQVETNVGNGRLFAYLAEHAEVTNTEYLDSRVTFNCRIPRRFISGLNGDDIRVTLEAGLAAPTAGVQGDGNGHANGNGVPAHS